MAARGETEMDDSQGTDGLFYRGGGGGGAGGGGGGRGGGAPTASSSGYGYDATGSWGPAGSRGGDGGEEWGAPSGTYYSPAGADTRLGSLRAAWVAERAAPEVLPYEAEAVNGVQELLSTQEAWLAEAGRTPEAVIQCDMVREESRGLLMSPRKGGGRGEEAWTWIPSSSTSAERLPPPLPSPSPQVRAEVSRGRFLLRAYQRARLHKIQAAAVHLQTHELLFQRLSAREQASTALLLLLLLLPSPLSLLLSHAYATGRHTHLPLPPRARLLLRSLRKGMWIWRKATCGGWPSAPCRNSTGALSFAQKNSNKRAHTSYSCTHQLHTHARLAARCSASPTRPNTTTCVRASSPSTRFAAFALVPVAEKKRCKCWRIKCATFFLPAALRSLPAGHGQARVRAGDSADGGLPRCCRGGALPSPLSLVG